jgi:hypothetical protein
MNKRRKDERMNKRRKDERMKGKGREEYIRCIGGAMATALNIGAYAREVAYVYVGGGSNTLSFVISITAVAVFVVAAVVVIVVAAVVVVIIVVVVVLVAGADEARNAGSTYDTGV